MNPLQSFINQISQAVMGTPEDESPVGAALRGNFSDVVPAIQRRTSYFAQHPENISFAGEMSEPSGAFSDALGQAEGKVGASQSLPTKLANAISPNIKKVTSANPDELGSTFRNADIQDTYRRWNAYDPQSRDIAARNIYDNIVNPRMAANPKLVSLDDTTDAVVNEMRKLQPGLDPMEAKNAAHRVIIDLYNQGVQTNQGIVPTDIPSSNLLDMRTALNGTHAVKNYFNGITPTSATDLSAVAARNAFSNILENLHPDVSQAIRDYGNLAEGAPSMTKAAGQGTGFNLFKPNTYLNAVPKAAEATLRGDSRVLGPIATGLGVGGTLATMQGLPAKIADTITGHSEYQAGQKDGGQPDSSQINEGTPINVQSPTTIPQSIDQVQPDQSGHYGVVNPFAYKGPDGQPLVPSGADYQSKLAQLLQQKAEATYQGPKAVNEVQSQIDALNNQYQITSGLGQAYQKAQYGSNLLNNLQDQLSDPKLAVGIQNAFGINGFNVGALQNLHDPKIARLVTTIQTLEKSGVIDASNLSTAQNVQSLKNEVDQAARSFLFQFYSGLNTYTGAGAQRQPATLPPVPGGLPAPTGQGLPPAPVIDTSRYLAPLNAPIGGNP